MPRREAGWTMELTSKDYDFVLRVIDPAGQNAEKIQALENIGLLAYGAPHQRHHWMLARGKDPASH